MNVYKVAANTEVDPEAKEMLSNLAEWEVSHEKIFRDMRSGFTHDQKQPTVFDPDNEMGLYLKSMASQVVFTSKMDPVEMIGANPSLRKVLDIALEREKDAGVREIVPASLGRDKTEA